MQNVTLTAGCPEAALGSARLGATECSHRWSRVKIGLSSFVLGKPPLAMIACRTMSGGCTNQYRLCQYCVGLVIVRACDPVGLTTWTMTCE